MELFVGWAKEALAGGACGATEHSGHLAVVAADTKAEQYCLALLVCQGFEGLQESGASRGLLGALGWICAV